MELNLINPSSFPSSFPSIIHSISLSVFSLPQYTGNSMKADYHCFVTIELMGTIPGSKTINQLKYLLGTNWASNAGPGQAHYWRRKVRQVSVFNGGGKTQTQKTFSIIYSKTVAQEVSATVVWGSSAQGSKTASQSRTSVRYRKGGIQKAFQIDNSMLGRQKSSWLRWW